MLYTTTAWSKVYAVTPRPARCSGTTTRKCRGETGYKACCDVNSRGLAVAEGKVFVAALDGRLIALDAETGALLWSTVTVDQTQPYTITGAPRCVKGNVVIGNSGGEFGVRGYVSAYDAETGKLAWRFYTVPGDPAKGRTARRRTTRSRKLAQPTWFGKWYEYGGGGTVWDSIVYDQELDQLVRRHRQRLAVESTLSLRRQGRQLVLARACSRSIPTPANTFGTTRNRRARRGTTPPRSR